MIRLGSWFHLLDLTLSWRTHACICTNISAGPELEHRRYLRPNPDSVVECLFCCRCAFFLLSLSLFCRQWTMQWSMYTHRTQSGPGHVEWCCTSALAVASRFAQHWCGPIGLPCGMCRAEQFYGPGLGYGAGEALFGPPVYTCFVESRRQCPVPPYLCIRVCLVDLPALIAPLKRRWMSGD